MIIAKKAFFYIGVFLLIFLSSSCSEQNIDTEYFDNIIVYGTNAEDDVYSDVGILNTLNGIVYLFDPVSGIRAPLCTKVNCKHEGKTLANQYPTCDAYLSFWVNETAIVGDYLYYAVCPEDENLNIKDMFIKEFYRADKNGKNRKLLYRTEDAQNFLFGFYENGYMAYSYANNENRDREVLKKNTFGIILIDLKSEETIHIRYEKEFYSGQVLFATITDEYIYYALCYFTEDIKQYSFDFISDPVNKDYMSKIYKAEIWRYNIESGEQEKYMELDPTKHFIVGRGHIVYKDSDEMGITLKNLVTNEEHNIRGENFQKLYGSFNDMGFVFTVNGKIRLWRFGAKMPEELGTYNEKENLHITIITQNWVYASTYDDEKGHKELYCPRTDFLFWQYDWQEADIGH